MISLEEMLNKIGLQRQQLGCVSIDAPAVTITYKPSTPGKLAEDGNRFYIGFPATVDVVFDQQGNFYHTSLMFVESQPRDYQIIALSEQESLEASELLAKYYQLKLYIEPIIVNELEEYMYEEACKLLSMVVR